MYTQNRNNIERHVKTHSQRSDEDRSAVTILETFLRANGKISTNFSKEDKWPNIDGTLEFVENPLITRRPKQNFFVQIKGTHLYTETDNGIKYSLKSLAFPAFIYQIVSEVIESTPLDPEPLGVSRFYIQKKVPFFIGKERYYELTLQLAGVYATKYNRITAYTKDNISTSYSVQIGYKDAIINLWGVNSHIKIVTNWKVSIEPSCLNKLGKILGFSLKLSSKFGEYGALMNLLTQTGINLLDMIDLQEVSFSALLDSIYKNTNTALFKDVLTKLRNNYSEKSTRVGCHVIRYLLLNLREETIESVLPTQYGKQLRNDDNLYLSSKCLPFEKNPFISNLVGRKTSEGSAIQSVLRVAGNDSLDVVRPYLTIKNQIKQTGEIYFEESSVANERTIAKFNDSLDRWELQQGHQIKCENGFVYIDLYEKTTISILQKLIHLIWKTLHA